MTPLCRAVPRKPRSVGKDSSMPPARTSRAANRPRPAPGPASPGATLTCAFVACHCCFAGGTQPCTPASWCIRTHLRPMRQQPVCQLRRRLQLERGRVSAAGGTTDALPCQAWLLLGAGHRARRLRSQGRRPRGRRCRPPGAAARCCYGRSPPRLPAPRTKSASSSSFCRANASLRTSHPGRWANVRASLTDELVSQLVCSKVCLGI